MCYEIKGMYDKIIIMYVPSYTIKNILHPTIALLLLNSTTQDSNKLMIFSIIALYYGDTYITTQFSVEFEINSEYHSKLCYCLY